MIALLRAFAWLRWRLLVNFLKNRRRDTLGRLARWADPLAKIGVVLMLMPLVPLLTLGGAAFGWAVGAEKVQAQTAATLMRVMLLVWTLGILIMPIGFGGRPVLPSPSRFLLLPIERSRLHMVRFLSGLADPWLLAGGTPILLFPLGLLIAGRPWTAAVSLAAGVLLILLIAAFSSWITSSIQLLLRQRRRGDMFALLFLIGLICLSFSAAAFDDDNDLPAGFEEAFFYLNPPGELYVQSHFSRYAGSAAVLLPLLGLALTAVGFFFLSEKAHDRLLVEPGAAAGPRKSRSAQPTRWLLPGISPAASAVALTQVRVILRTVPGKIALLQGLFMVVLMGVLFSKVPKTGWTAYVPPEMIVLTAIMAFAYLGVVQFVFNQFALDRAGLTLLFLLPLSPRDLVLGKTVGLGILTMGSLVVAIVPALLVAGPTLMGALSSAVFALLSLASVCLLISPVAVLMSALLPRSVNFGKAFASNQPHSLATIVGMLAAPIACGIPMALALVTVLLFKSYALATLLLLLWLVATALIARLTLPLVAEAVRSRREAVLLAAQER